MADIINFIDVYNKKSLENNKEGLDAYVGYTFALVYFKLKGLEVSGEDAPNLQDELPYTNDEIYKAIDIVNEFIIDNYDADDVNTITCLPDEISKLAVQYLLEKDLVTLDKLTKVPGGFRDLIK